MVIITNINKNKQAFRQKGSAAAKSTEEVTGSKPQNNN